MTNDTNNNGLLPLETLPITKDGTSNDNGETVTINPGALESLCVLRDCDPVLTRKWNQTVYASPSNDPSVWNSITFENGDIVEINLGGTMRLKNLIPNAFSSMKKLRTLSLAGTDLPVDQIIGVLEAITDADIPITGLFLGSLDITDYMMEKITPFIGKLATNSLKKLDLRYNLISSGGAESLCMALCKSTGNIDKTCTLKKLYMEGNKLGDNGAAAIAQYLASTNCILAELFLGDNKIGPQGASNLANALPKNTTLTKLYLEGNKVGPDGALAFTEVLEANENITLKHLFVDNNGLGKESAQRLARALKLETMIDGF